MKIPEATGSNGLNPDVLRWALARGMSSHLKIAPAREIEQLQPVVERLRIQASQSDDQCLREAVEALNQQIHEDGTGPIPLDKTQLALPAALPDCGEDAERH